MQTNEYIYPFKPFQPLSDKSIKDNIGHTRSISQRALAELIWRLPPLSVSPAGAGVEERILSIFEDDEIRLGPCYTAEPEMRSLWLGKLASFTERAQPIQFCIMACPFKVHVPLKIDRITCDMAEALFVHRLNELARLVKAVYEPGAVITILAEGIFGRFMDVSFEDYTLYRKSLERLVEWLRVGDVVRVHNLDEIESRVPEFPAIWRKYYEHLAQLYRAGDAAFKIEFEGSFDSVYRLVAAPPLPLEALMDLYNPELPDKRVSQEVREARRELRTKATEAVLQYRAFIRARDEAHYIEQLLPGSLKMTVSAKRENLGIHPINKESLILPHHTTIVYYPQTGRFISEYLIDIRRRSAAFEAVYVEQDFEDRPFYYHQLNTEEPGGYVPRD